MDYADSKLLDLAVPLFLISMAIEIVAARRRPGHGYKLYDAVCSLSCGVGRQVLLGSLGWLGFVSYAAVQKHFGLFQISEKSILAWVILVFLDDFLYWLYHYASHRVNFLWATHSVHHQSEEYNLSTALRQSWFTGITAFVFYLPIALLGYSLWMWVTVHAVNLIYQFFIHTRLVGKLGPLEWVLNTPSHHRVHHGIDPRYIDKNHAGIFIIWDRLFRTFKEEDVEPHYGTVKPLARFDPGWANFAEWQRLFAVAARTRRFRDKLLLFVMPPEWRPADLGGIVIPPEVPADRKLYTVRAPRGIGAYAVICFFLALPGMLAMGPMVHVSPLVRTAIGAEVLLCLWTVAALVESKRWALGVEIARLISAMGLALLLPIPTAGQVGMIVTCGVLLCTVLFLVKRRGAEPSPLPQPAVAS